MRTLAIITIVAMLLGGGLTEWARAERHSLPRTFEHARLGMAFDEWTQTSGR
jgi:hypothetical protein